MTITITREIEITVEVRYIPGTPATYMQPAEHADIEILDAFDELNQGVELTEAEIDEVRENAINGY
jgi:septation ring formation regulator EzrA